MIRAKNNAVESMIDYFMNRAGVSSSDVWFYFEQGRLTIFYKSDTGKRRIDVDLESSYIADCAADEYAPGKTVSLV